MGEIIIKVPENIHEVIELDLPYDKVKKKLEEIGKNDGKEFLEFLLRNAGKLREEDLPSEEDIYMQGD